MRIGYACLTVGVPATEIKSCRIKNADENRLYEITDNNLKSLEHMLEYNIDNDITLYRISSDIIPFGSSPVNTLQWWDVFERQFNKLSDIIYKHNIRVSMHPGQYTVLNSPNTEVVKEQ
jgi:UV DNA damage endonuclease